MFSALDSCVTSKDKEDTQTTQIVEEISNAMLESNSIKSFNAKQRDITACTISSINIGPCRKVTARQAGKRNRVFWRLPPTAALVVPDHQPASNTVPSKRACFGCRTKIIRPSAASKLIHIFVSAVRSVPAKVRMELSSTVAPGMQSRWCRLKIGRDCTASRFPMLPRPRPHNQLFTFCHAAPDSFSSQGRLFFDPF